jgi:HxlR-like helix-turn-helix
LSKRVISRGSRPASTAAASIAALPRSRIVEPTTPVSVRYQLTPRGRELIALLHPLVMHAQRWPAPEDTATEGP